MSTETPLDLKKTVNLEPFSGEVIVNNGAWIVRSNIHTTDAELFDRCMAVNVRAPLLLFKAAFDELQRNQGAVLKH